MSNATAPAPPAITTAEKVAMLGATFVVGVLLATPVTRGIAVDSVIAVAHFVADTVTGVLRAVGTLLGLA
jgi:hypothetical protein